MQICTNDCFYLELNLAKALPTCNLLPTGYLDDFPAYCIGCCVTVVMSVTIVCVYSSHSGNIEKFKELGPLWQQQVNGISRLVALVCSVPFHHPLY